MTAFILVARSPALELAQNSNLDGVCSDVTKANGKKNRLQKSVRKDANCLRILSKVHNHLNFTHLSLLFEV